MFIIVEPEKIKVTLELNAGEFIKTEISGDMKEITKEDNIQLDSGDAISAKSVVFGGSVVTRERHCYWQVGGHFSWWNLLFSLFERTDACRCVTSCVCRL